MRAAPRHLTTSFPLPLQTIATEVITEEVVAAAAASAPTGTGEKVIGQSIGVVVITGEGGG